MTANSHEWFADESYWEMNRSFIWSDRRIEMSGTAVTRIMDLLGMKSGESVLDLACGFGRHSLLFAEHGLDVTGVDLNSAFIEEAKSKAIAARQNIRFVRADMREFKEPNSYGYIVLLYNSFGYFTDQEDDERVLRNSFESLLPGGKMLISVMGREINERLMSSKKDRTWWGEEGNYRLHECVMNEDRSWATIRMIILKGSDQQIFEYGVRLYSEPELVKSLTDAGFEDIQTYGSLSGSRYDDEASGLHAVAAKPQDV